MSKLRKATLHCQKCLKCRLHKAFVVVVTLIVPRGAVSFDERLTGAVLIGEAGGGGVAGMIAIGEGIANRARKRQMPPGLAAGAEHFEDIRAPVPRWARVRGPVAVVGGHRNGRQLLRRHNRCHGRPKPQNQPV
jgi:hypothetical protein